MLLAMIGKQLWPRKQSCAILCIMTDRLTGFKMKKAVINFEEHPLNVLLCVQPCRRART